MRVNLITNNLPRYKKTNKQQANSSPLSYLNTQSSFIIQNASPSFSGLFGIGKKTAGKIAEVAIPTAKTVEKKLDPVKQVLQRLEKISENERKKLYSCINDDLKSLTAIINDETAPFVNKLIDLLTPSQIKESLKYQLQQIDHLTEKFNNYPATRKTMQKSLEREIKQKNDLSIFRLNELFSYNYKGSDIQNRFIEKIIDAKGFDGKPRFRSFSTSETFDYLSTKEQEQALDLILHRTIISDDEINIKKLAKAIKDSSVVDFEKNEKAAVTPGKKQFLVDSESDINSILEKINADKLPVLKTILSRVNYAVEITTVLENYVPEKQAFLEKGLSLVDEGKLSLMRLGMALKYAGKE